MSQYDIGKKIKEFRDLRGLSQEQLVGDAGISRKSLQDIENSDDSNPTVKTLEAVSEVLDVPITSLFDAPRGQFHSPELRDATAILQQMASVDPDHLRAVLAVLFQNLGYMRGRPKLADLVSSVERLITLLPKA